MRADFKDILYNEDLIILNKFFFILQSNFYKIFDLLKNTHTQACNISDSLSFNLIIFRWLYMP